MYRRRRRAYFLLMGVCLVLFVSAWAFVRLWSMPAAIAMCVVAMVIPPVAAMVGNRKGPEDRWWDEPGAERERPPGAAPPGKDGGATGDPESDAWWEELDGRKRRR
ncbi:DUF3099 domain-containing protein [Streptomyces sp. OfavH-34-F]|uniref:DUF3099 domain-containing protein n=1 Tax=Streptomyces sp. OfavH-34-F TaxID=2917760 RepID=UPI001EF1AD2A|nr:DUF3099 domain-containing protein [Streptomyces sp. OfavH-34-F]MCG7523913.1 DUF3099 domain-containing protein [Streptomyces sp. OfavH-34-F]